MALIFGSELARSVLLRDRERRVGRLKMHGQSNGDGTILPPPAHYVAATWEDWQPDEWDEEQEVLDE